MRWIPYLLTLIMLFSILPACTSPEYDEYMEIDSTQTDVKSKTYTTQTDTISKPETAQIDSIDFNAKTVLHYEESIGFVITGATKWMTQVKGGNSRQGADCFQNLLLQFRVNHTAIDIMDMEQRKHVLTVVLPSLGNAYHCNNADFSNTFYDETDAFPLLYSSHQGKAARCILVDRIIYEGEDVKLKTIQRIDIPFELDKPLEYTPDAIIDKDNNFLYVYTGNTIPITDFFIYKFRLPSISEGGTVRLTKEDAISCWTICDNPSFYKQGGMVKDDVMYIMEGVPAWDKDNILRIIDLKNNSYKLINLSKELNVKWEPEDIFIYKNDFYVASNRMGVFKLKIETNK